MMDTKPAWHECAVVGGWVRIPTKKIIHSEVSAIKRSPEKPTLYFSCDEELSIVRFYGLALIARARNS